MWFGRWRAKDSSCCWIVAEKLAIICEHIQRWAGECRYKQAKEKRSPDTQDHHIKTRAADASSVRFAGNRAARPSTSGHVSRHMIFSSYREIATPEEEEAEQCWRIFPPEPAENVVSMAKRS
jgi:hypothetical protein